MKKTILFGTLIFLCASINYTKAFSFKETVSNAWNTVTFKKQKSETANFQKKVPPHTKITVNNLKGPITIKTWDRNEIVIETEKTGPDKIFENTIIEQKLTDASYKISTNVKNKTDKPCTVAFTILAPKNATFYSITTDNGDITINDSTQSVSALSKTGNISVINSSGEIKVHADYGNIKITQQIPNPKDSIVVSAECGNIDLIVPKSFNNANLYATARRGKINSSIPITTTITTEINRKAMAKLTKNIAGTIGKGGAHIKLQTERGMINITTA